MKNCFKYPQRGDQIGHIISTCLMDVNEIYFLQGYIIRKPIEMEKLTPAGNQSTFMLINLTLSNTLQ